MAVQSTPVLDKTFKAAGDLSAKLFHSVRLAADYTVDAATGPQVQIGILQNEPAAPGRGARVRMLGTSPGVAGGAFAAGAKLTANALGRLVVAGAGEECIAIACQAALADGDIVEVDVMPGMRT